MSRLRPVDRPLRRDVRRLGQLLGEVLIEQEGEAIFALEERVRALAIARRRGPRERRAEAAAELAAVLGALPLEQAVPVLRAFAVYFRLVNLAEQHHRIRRARAHAMHPEAPPQRGSLAAVLEAAYEAGVPAAEAREAIGALEVTLTFTAHPTEAARRTILEKLHRIWQALERADRAELTPVEAEDLERAVREEVTALWQTDELRRERPTVGDEVKNVLFYLEEVLWGVVPSIGRELARAFERAYGEPLGFEPTPLRLHSWVGGDMDGNPAVTREVLADAVRLYRERGLERILAEVAALGGVLSQSSRYVSAPPALVASLDEDARRMPAVAARQGPRTEGEPWRRKLLFVEARLEATLAATRASRAPAREAAPPTNAGLAYASADELIGDLELVADTLHEAGAARAGEGRARALLARVRSVGLHIAELEARVVADEPRAAAAWLDGRGPRTDDVARFMGTLETIAAAQAEAGEGACRTLILSMTRDANDVLAALRCAREAGLWDEGRACARLDVVPLFETLDALRAAPGALRAMLADPTYRRHVAARGAQEVMLGYSDSSKEVGLLAANAALLRAQEALPAVAREAGIALRLFHGRGETVARGAGPLQQAILALPPGAVGGRYKATEQGEALDMKYARPKLAHRTLELMVGGALQHTVGATKQPSPAELAVFSAAFDELAETGRRAYRELVWEDPRFLELFEAATPIDAIGRLPIGSRPSKRRAGGLEALRAIPWVFAWTQNRAILPGWYGVGTAFEAFAARPGGAERLAEMVAGWPFFATLVANVEMVLAKSDIGIASRYARLAPEAAREAIWPRVRAEHRRTKAWVLRLTGSRKLLEDNPTLARSIALRNPYVDPMSFLQIALLRGLRAGDERYDRPVLLTLNGIAAGLRNTG
jgi:phosphoenolpyruvate carboxylase